MISYELRIIFVFLASYFTALFVLPKLAHIAQRIGLLDQPNGRKVHKKPRPLVGGIGMVIAITFSSLVFIPINGLRGYFLGLAVLLLIGFFDDFKEIGYRQKFLAQVAATGFLIHFSKVSLVTFGDLLGIGAIAIPGGMVVVWLVTVFCVVGVINSVNLIDGLDGLAGGISFIAFIFFAIHSSLAGNHTLMLLNLAIAGAILGFLYFNWHPSKLFMGDAGSLCLGFSLAFMALAMTQVKGSAMSPVSALLILAVPITDTIIVMSKRILRGQSPFAADKYHLHHIFLRCGMTRCIAVRAILGLSLLMGGCSLLQPILHLSDAWLFLLFMLYFVVYLGLSFYIVAFFRYSIRLRKKRENKVSADLILRLLFGTFDIFRLFRKSQRHAVNLQVQCLQEEPALNLAGRMLNLSFTGCMLKIEGAECVVQARDASLFFTLAFINEKFTMRLLAEHLWHTDHEGSSYHGFRFKGVTPEQRHTMREYFKQKLSGKRQSPYQSVTA